MAKTINLGVIGVGMYGKVLINAFQKDPRAEVTWVNSASEVTTRSAADQFLVKKWTLDYCDVLSDPAVDAVVIATPPYLHKEVFMAALEAGKHVLIEKPLTISAEEARQMSEVHSHPGSDDRLAAALELQEQLELLSGKVLVLFPGKQ